MSGRFGNAFLNWVKSAYAPAGSCDLVTYFLRRIYNIIKQNGFGAILTTNSISEGSTRDGGLDVILKDGGTLNYVQKSVRWPGVANLYVSLISLYKGEWQQERILENQIVGYISGRFEDYEDLGKPHNLKQNEKQMFQGSIFLGDGFILDDPETKEMLQTDPKNQDVIFPLINGKDVNSTFHQHPQRHIINFFNWGEGKAREYQLPYEKVRELVKPVRKTVKRETRRNNWWLYAERSAGLYSAIAKLKFCFLVVCQATKYLNFSVSPTDRVYTNALFVYATDNFYNYTIVQSTIHNEWARKYSSSLETRLRYTPANCFETFPFPQNITGETESTLVDIGEQYHEFRRQVMYRLRLGLTKTYNLFHTRDLSEDMVENACKQDKEITMQAHKDIIHLRKLHEQMDNAVLAAYGWTDIDLRYNFYDMDYLPENDCTRYTFSPVARKEILMRLLKLNHDLYSKEQTESLPDKKIGASKKTKAAIKKGQLIPGNLFE